ncbi:MAG: hypothetical protein JJT85_04430 [Chromatiales bacterium]|nr:hypothetical protein [Chromatiales bacterium]
MSSERREEGVTSTKDPAGCDPDLNLALRDSSLAVPRPVAERDFSNEDTRWRRDWIAQALDGARRSAGSTAPGRRKPRLRVIRGRRA